MTAIDYLADDTINHTPVSNNNPLPVTLNGAGGAGSPVSSANPLPVTQYGESYGLLTNASASGDPVQNVAGGSYLWANQGTFSGATLTLQVLGPDGVNYLDVATATEEGTQGVVIGNGATVQVTVTDGPPSGIYSSLS